MEAPLLTGAAVLAAACAGNDAPASAGTAISEATTIVTTESGVLARPVDVAVDASGTVQVLDALEARIVLLSPEGDLRRTVGSPGNGPREFSGPRTFVLDGDSARVVDSGNGRLLTLALEGGASRSVRLPPGAHVGPVALHPAGWLVAGTYGLQNATASVHDPSGAEQLLLGTPLAPPTMMLDMRAMKEEIIAGDVPAFFQNAVYPVIGDDRTVWLVRTGDRMLERYDSTGARQFSGPFAVPEVERIQAHVVARNQEMLDDPRRIHAPEYVTDGAVVGGALWLLMKMPDEEPAVLLKFTPDGAVDHRLVFTGVRGATAFAFDVPRGRVLFAVPGDATLMAAPLPRQLSLR